MTNKVTHTKLATQGSYFYATQKKKVTSELHKLTNYKSNYTSTMYMKVTTSLCKGIANQREEQSSHGDFSPEVHVLANTLCPR